jgi:hypothetical protein
LQDIETLGRASNPLEGAPMFIAKVIGNVVATQKNEKFLGMKLLLIQPYIAKDGKLPEICSLPSLAM